MKCISSPLLLAGEGGGGRGGTAARYLISNRGGKRDVSCQLFPRLFLVASSSVGRELYKFVRTFARAARATIIAIGFAPISVASPT